MKVGSLFAEIGFKVDNSGLQQFSNALKSFQKQISSGLKDLRAYAKAAREISQAMRDAYIPTQKEAGARYRAETRRISSQARLTYVRAKQFVQDSNTRASNARSRERQVTLRERGGSARSWSSGENVVKALTMLSPKTLFSSIGTAIGGLFGASGAAIGAHIGQLIDKVIGAIFRAATWLGKTILSGIRFGMAYRDYRNFTGRSTSGLGGLMARTFNTATMRPEDVLRDAARLETEYWDMILGGGNPAIYQLLGVHPTGRGETDMQNLLGAIGRVTGGFSNRSLARSLMRQSGFSEEYLNMMLDEDSGQIDINRLLGRAREWETANKAIKEFQYSLKMIAGDIAKEFVSSGLLETIKTWLKDLAGNLPSIIQVFKDLFVALKSFLTWLKDMFPTAFGVTPQQSRQDAQRRMSERMGPDGGYLSLIWQSLAHPIDYARAMGRANYGFKDLAYDYLTKGIATPIYNSFYVQTPEEAEKIASGMARDVPNSTRGSGQGIQGQINDSFSQTKF